MASEKSELAKFWGKIVDGGQEEGPKLTVFILVYHASFWSLPLYCFSRKLARKRKVKRSLIVSKPSFENFLLRDRFSKK